MVNAASYVSANLPGGALASGSIFAIFGTGLGPAGPGIQASRFPLDPTLGGVAVRVTSPSGASVAAIPLFVSSGQINALLPSTVPIGPAAVAVTYNGATSRGEPMKIVRSSFGFFARNSGGAGPLIAQNFVSAAEQPLNSPATPASPGQTVILWGTGLGPIATLDQLPPPVGNLNEPAELLLAGRPVTLDYRGRSGCCAGVDQLQLRIPADAPLGCAVPLSLSTENGVPSNLGTIAISADGRPCADSSNLPGSASRWAEISLTRTVVEAGDTVDTARAVFGSGDPPARYPTPGTCTSSVADPASLLDAGMQLTLTGPAGPRAVLRGADGPYVLSATGTPGFLGPGVYTASGAGGAGVGSFSATLNGAAALSWIASGTRATGLTVRWSGASGGDFVLLSAPAFTCAAATGAGVLTIPRSVLSNVPATLRLGVGLVSQASFGAPGLDAGVIRHVTLTARDVPLGPPLLAASPVRLPDGQAVLAELAVTLAEQERGLMSRTELNPDRGMLFLFDRADFYGFWMYQTLIPLDIVWLDANRRIVFISANTPPCQSASSQACPVYGGQQQSQYVLELAADEALRHRLQLGDRLEF